jgi:hypothetical protein
MQTYKDKARNLSRSGNSFLFVGMIWGFFAAFVCPCPLCVSGTLSFLSAGIMGKTGFGRPLARVQ